MKLNKPKDKKQKKATLTHIIIKLLEISDKKKILEVARGKKNNILCIGEKR